MKPEIDAKGIKYTLTVTSALFKGMDKVDGLERFYVVTLQNQVFKPDSDTNYKIYPIDIQVQQLAQVDRSDNATIRNNYFVE